jgi:hypothetical protein
MAFHFRKRIRLFFSLAGLIAASLSIKAQTGDQSFRVEQLSELTRIGCMIGKGIPISTVQHSWKIFVGSNKSLDIDKAVKKLIASSKQEAKTNVADKRKEMQFQSQLRKTISNEMTEVRSMLKRKNYTKDPFLFFQRKSILLTPDTQGNVIVLQTGSISDRREMVKYADELENQLKLAQVNAKLANTDLQNALQEQQKMISTLSNVAKQLSDSAMSVIRKIGG